MRRAGAATSSTAPTLALYCATNAEPAKKYRRQQEIAGFALAIARKIAARGTKGRWILRDLAPRMAKHYWRAFRASLKQLSASPPR